MERVDPVRVMGEPALYRGKYLYWPEAKD